MPLPSNTTLVKLCAAIYSDDVDPKDWDHLDLGLDDGVFWALKKFPDYSVISARGSDDPRDWIRDAMGLPLVTPLGTVHAGFYLGTPKAWDEAKAILEPGKPVYVTGHSLGASHASMICGHMILDGVIPAGRVVFGEPNPGFADFCDLLKPIPRQASFLNGAGHRHDIVTDVPWRIPPALLFGRPEPMTEVTALPTGDLFERYEAFAWHHISLYAQGTEAYEAALAARSTVA